MLSGEIETADAVGDTVDFSYGPSKLSDDDINAYDFDIVMFEPEDSAYPTTYFDFSGDRQYASTTPSDPVDYALTEADALLGSFQADSCNLYTVCNFGRGHCSGTVMSAMGYASSGGCGEYGPIVGDSGVTEGNVRVYIYTASPTPHPTFVPMPVPTAVPIPLPTAAPTVLPTFGPTAVPTVPPTAAPTLVPTPLPTTLKSPASILPQSYNEFKERMDRGCYRRGSRTAYDTEGLCGPSGSGYAQNSGPGRGSNDPANQSKNPMR